MLNSSCVKCGIVKPLTDEFFPMRGDRPCLDRTCRDCKKAYLRDYYARNRERAKAASRAYRLANPDQARQCRQRYVERNYDRHRERIREWVRRNPEKACEYANARRARKASAPGRYTIRDVRRILEEQNGCCFYCGTDLGSRYHVEHKTPLARGGTNYPSNICCACPDCNARKSLLTAEEFFARMAG